MKVAVVFIIVSVFIIFSSFLGQFSVNEPSLQQANISQTLEDIPQEESVEEQTPVKTVKPKATISPQQPVVLIDTHINAGPEEGEIIEDTNRVTFEFEGKIYSEIKGKIYFETKFLGFDDKWVSSRSEKRTVKLSPGPREYTFLVRAKTNNFIDFTPAKRTFKINTSPYFDKVEISSIRKESSSNPALITLNTNL
ncbi:MAG: hypothetical protein KJI71_03980, partial [Patescibacteria group bacterium]|nr:hypothetical protein [Patescibacteria group bacterium]